MKVTDKDLKDVVRDAIYDVYSIEDYYVWKLVKREYDIHSMDYLQDDTPIEGRILSDEYILKAINIGIWLKNEFDLNFKTTRVTKELSYFIDDCRVNPHRVNFLGHEVIRYDHPLLLLKPKMYVIRDTILRMADNTSQQEASTKQTIGKLLYKNVYNIEGKSISQIQDTILNIALKLNKTLKLSEMREQVMKKLIGVDVLFTSYDYLYIKRRDNGVVDRIDRRYINRIYSFSELNQFAKKRIKYLKDCMNLSADDSYEMNIRCMTSNVDKLFENMLMGKPFDQGTKELVAWFSSNERPATWKDIKKRFDGMVIGISSGTFNIGRDNFDICVALASEPFKKQREYIRDHKIDIVRFVMEELAKTREFKRRIGIDKSAFSYYRVTDIVLLRSSELYIKWSLKPEIVAKLEENEETISE